MRDYLKQLRKKLNLTQQNVADKIGIVQQYYNMIENGERQKKMDLDLIQKLSTVFNVPIVVPFHINTRVAFEVWGIDVKELERNRKKLKELELG